MTQIGDGMVHFTHLRSMALSPAHYYASVTEPRAQTAAMRFGSLVHHVYAGEPVIVYEGERRGNAWKEFQAANDGAEIFTRAEADKAARCAESLRTSLRKIAGAEHVMTGEMERHIEWENLGRRCSSRLDVLGDGFVTDLKTTNCAEPGRFSRAATGRFAYHAQLAFYGDAAAYIKNPPKDRYIVAVETAPPFAVTVLRLTPRCIEEGGKHIRLWLEQLLNCERSGEWPAYCQSVVDLDCEQDYDLTIDGEVIE
jgi:hypothetical protein